MNGCWFLTELKAGIITSVAERACPIWYECKKNPQNNRVVLANGSDSFSFDSERLSHLKKSFYNTTIKKRADLNCFREQSSCSE